MGCAAPLAGAGASSPSPQAPAGRLRPFPGRAHAYSYWALERRLGIGFLLLSFPSRAILQKPSHTAVAEECPLSLAEGARALGAPVSGCGAALARRGLSGGAERGGVRGGRGKGARGPGRSPDAGRYHRRPRGTRRRRRSGAHPAVRGRGRKKAGS